MNSPKRPGYYVEGRYFQDRLHQARARAAWLSKEYGRGVPVLFVNHHEDEPQTISIVFNGGDNK